MPYRANIIKKIIKKFKGAKPPFAKATVGHSKFGEQVKKWLATEGRNFITMATL